MDPLVALPAEVVLRIINFASVRSIANLTLASRAWHDFIDSTHQDAIYAAKVPGVTKLNEPERYFQDWNSFAKIGQGVSSWKEICRRRFALERSWGSERPRPLESVIQVGDHPVWRFRPDFKRRFIVSTSQAGGLNVTDMDTGDLLWSLSTEEVRQFAHLEYQDGTAVWDRFRNTLEVWKTDLPGLRRGQFQQVALLPHDVTTRGFQLSYHTLCVVSSEGQGFVYDLPPHPEKPVLRTRVEIDEGAVGHLDQSEDAVIYSLDHVVDSFSFSFSDNLLPHPSRRIRLARLQIREGVHPPLNDQPFLRDEWGAGMLSGNTMVGTSREGRLVICADWRHALRGRDEFLSVTSLVECDPTGDGFDLGGWLHIHETIDGKKVIFEIKNSVYIISLDTEGRPDPQKPTFATHTFATPELAVPISFMGIYDDCIMSTFTALAVNTGNERHPGTEWERRVVPTKAIRVLGFAPDLLE